MIRGNIKYDVRMNLRNWSYGSLFSIISALVGCERSSLVSFSRKEPSYALNRASGWLAGPAELRYDEENNCSCHCTDLNPMDSRP
jgi:hypothetical protein